jgi:hypothetical protein
MPKKLPPIPLPGGVDPDDFADELASVIRKSLDAYEADAAKIEAAAAAGAISDAELAEIEAAMAAAVAQNRKVAGYWRSLGRVLDIATTIASKAV